MAAVSRDIRGPASEAFSLSNIANRLGGRCSDPSSDRIGQILHDRPFSKGGIYPFEDLMQVGSLKRLGGVSCGLNPSRSLGRSLSMLAVNFFEDFLRILHRSSQPLRYSGFGGVK